MTNTRLEEKFESHFDLSNLVTYEYEFANSTTKPLIHQQARFLLFTRGSGKFVLNSKEYKVKKNSIALIIPWDISEIKEVDEPLDFIKIVFNYSAFTQYLSDMEIFTENNSAFYKEIKDNRVRYLDDLEFKSILRTMKKFRAEVGDISQYYTPNKDQFSRIYLLTLLIELTIEYLRSKNFTDKTSKDQFHVNINEVLSYMYSHLSEKLTLEKISSVFFMSKSSLTKYLKESINYTFKELLEDMKFSKSVDLLTYTSLSIKEIASEVGYNDDSHFINSFLQIEKVTPSEFREDYLVTENRLKLFQSDRKNDLIRYIENNFANKDLSISMVSKKFNMNKAYVNRLLNFQFEKNFTEYLNYLRVTRAIELLKSTDKAIEDISYEVGFNNSRSFRRAFNQILEISPSEFRKNVKLQTAEGKIIG
ncbi:AraC family transcriptional regulator [Anaerococcus sp. Marseille-P3625]|uniref:AraC family transcriptional regulator n=1 Tax=Anaerococcus sp. Marseille-P3625 TaxID=1977277 RepID=UPI000C07D3E8|nr:AraC family transcriptional regulator [Anaerococcus sp. Marseille-P3625]